VLLGVEREPRRDGDPLAADTLELLDRSVDGRSERVAARAELEAPAARRQETRRVGRDRRLAGVELAVLPEEVRLEEIEVGRDGLILESRGRRGLLLPQVATEWGFDAETFLAEVSRKAGLPPEGWRDPDARLWAFRAEVFSE